MNPNLNFDNEYFALIDKSNREKALSLIKKMSDSKPGLTQQSKIKIKDSTDGDLRIFIKNTSAFDYQTKRIILNYLNSIRKFY